MHFQQKNPDTKKRDEIVTVVEQHFPCMTRNLTLNDTANDTNM